MLWPKFGHFAKIGKNDQKWHFTYKWVKKIVMDIWKSNIHGDLLSPRKG